MGGGINTVQYGYRATEANYNDRARRVIENDGGQGTRSTGGEKEVKEINEVQKLKVEPSKNRDFEREHKRMTVRELILIKNENKRTRGGINEMSRCAV